MAITHTQRISPRYILAAVRQSSAEPAKLTFHRQASVGTPLVNGELLAPGQSGVAAAQVVPWPLEASWDFAPSTVVTPTQSTFGVERNGIRYGTVELGGIVGPMPQRWPGDGKTENDRIIAETVERLESLMKLVEMITLDPTLDCHLYAFNEGRFLRVEPTREMNSRGAPARTAMRYSLHFRILGPATEPTVDYVAAALQEEPAESPLVQAMRWCQNAASWVRRALDYVYRAIAWTKKNVTGPLERMITTAFDIANAIVDLADTLRGFLADLMRLPFRVYQMAMSLADRCVAFALECRRTLWDYWKDPFFTDAQGSEPEPPIGISSQDVREADYALTASSESMDRAAVLIRRAISEQRGRLVTDTVRQGETIEDVASRTLGDARRWREIVVANDLRAPYVSQIYAMPNVLGPGDRVVVPGRVRDGEMPASVAPPEASPDERAYGRTVQLARGQDGLLDFAPRNGSSGADGHLGFRDVFGVGCFSQSLDVRVNTELDSNLAFPTAGVPSALGLSNRVGGIGIFAAGLTRMIANDDRVATVADVAVQLAGNRIDFSATAVLQAGQTVAATQEGAR